MYYLRLITFTKDGFVNTFKEQKNIVFFFLRSCVLFAFYKYNGKDRGRENLLPRVGRTVFMCVKTSGSGHELRTKTMTKICEYLRKYYDGCAHYGTPLRYGSIAVFIINRHIISVMYSSVHVPFSKHVYNEQYP